ncbi:putative KHDC1-like protein [Lepus europaeus]|uniref:putative KHDC1-like protein n=1 Tax=Lepus europaeus TaxID=9983 RepID=UPI002B497B34|nr:putative KHDC1-like protein [Lepus europaeus]
MAMSTLSQKPWWMEPENFDAPMVVYLEEEQEEQIFGHSDTHLRCIEVHSQTLIQLESWFTATGQTRVTVVGPPRARQWLMDMIWSLGSPDSCIRARGREMLRQVQSRLLTEDDLAVPCGVRPDTGREPPNIGMSVTTSLELPLDPNLKSRDCFQFHWSSLYP